MILAFANPKGGVGKTTISVHLAGWFHKISREKGVSARVAFVDADAQKSSSAWLAEACPEIDCYKMSKMEDVLEQLPALRDEYDLVVVDGPAGDNDVTRTIMLLADGVFLPCGPSVMELKVALEAVELVKEAEMTRKEDISVRIIPNRIQKRYKLSNDLFNTLKDLDVWFSKGLGYRQAMADSVGQGKFVWDLGRSGAASTREFEELFEEILNDKDSTPEVVEK